MTRPLSVFISSPSDVAPERQRAERVIARLSAELQGLAELRAYRWERQFYTAQHTFQDQIPAPSASDIVVCIFWKRLGMPLPPTYRRADGTVPSGSEYEFEAAIHASRETGTPTVLVYRKTAEVLYSAATVTEEQAQHAALEAFWQRWFISPDGHIMAASNGFNTTDMFEALLESHLRQWLAQHDIGADTAITWPIGRLGSPFRGLQSFDATHAAVFFGRRRIIERLFERLSDAAQRGTPFLLVLGASGAGKSSVAKAGLLPRVVQPGAVAGVGAWRQATMRPSEGGPLVSLADALFQPGALPELAQGDSDHPPALAALARASPDAAARAIARAIGRAAQALAAQEGRTSALVRLVLLIDQAEELFAYAANETASFASLLRLLCASCDVWVVATMRSDFYAALQGVPALEQLKESGAQADLAPPTASDLTEVVLGPARAAGLRYGQRPGSGVTLDEELLQAAAEPGSLPLLQFALDELFNLREPSTNTLTFDAYDGFGGLSGVIERRAEVVFTALPHPAQAALPDLLRRLVAVDQDGLISTRAAAIERADSTAVGDLRDAFVAARLIVVESVGAETLYRLAHQALVARWPRAQQILAEDRDFLLVRARVEAAADQWRRGGEDFLLRPGRPLAEAAELLRARPAALAPQVVAFVTTSLAADRARRRRMGRRRATALGFAFLLLAVAAVLGVSAWNGHIQARLIAARNDEERAITALAAHDAAAAELLLARAIAADDRPQTRSLLEQARSHAAPVGVTIPAAAGAIVRAISADGRYAIRIQDGAAMLWNVGSGAAMRRLGDASGLSAASFSADGRQAALAWGRRVQVIGATADAPTAAPFDAGHRVVSLAFGGPILALGTDDKLVCVDRPEAEGREPELTCLGAAHTDQVWALAVTADGRTIASGSRDGKVRIWDVATGASRAPLTGHEDAVLAVALSPDGTMLSSGGWDDRILLWDVGSGRRLRTLVGHQGGVRALAFAADGLRLASGSEDATLRVWDIETGLPVQTLRGGGGDVDAVALGPATVVLGDAGGFLRTWDLSAVGNRPELATFGAFTQPASAVTFLGNGNVLAAASWDRTIRAFPPDALAAPRLIGRHDDDITALRSSADGRMLASASKDGTARIWHLGPNAAPAGGELIIAPEPDAPRTIVRDVAFTPDGKVLGTAGDDGKLRLFDTATGAKLRETSLDGPQLSLAFNRTAQLLAAAGQDGRITVLDAATLAAPRVLQGHHGAVWQVAFARGAVAPATLLVSASDDGAARLWDVASGRQIGPALEHATPLWAVDIDADAQQIATAGQDGSVTFWTLDQRDAGRAIQPTRRFVLRVCDGPVWSVAFSQSAPNILAIASADHRVRLWRGSVFQALVAQPRTLAADATREDGLQLKPAADEEGIFPVGARP